MRTSRRHFPHHRGPWGGRPTAREGATGREGGGSTLGLRPAPGQGAGTPHEPESIPFVGVGRKELLHSHSAGCRQSLEGPQYKTHWRVGMESGKTRASRGTRCTEKEGAFTRFPLRSRPLSRERGCETLLAAHCGVTAGLWLGRQAEGCHSRGERPGTEAADSTGHGGRGQWRAKPQPCLPTGLPRDGLYMRCPMQVPQHQQVFEEFTGPSGLPSSSSSSAKASS